MPGPVRIYVCPICSMQARHRLGGRGKRASAFVGRASSVEFPEGQYGMACLHEGVPGNLGNGCYSVCASKLPVCRVLAEYPPLASWMRMHSGSETQHIWTRAP